MTFLLTYSTLMTILVLYQWRRIKKLKHEKAVQLEMLEWDTKVEGKLRESLRKCKAECKFWKGEVR